MKRNNILKTAALALLVLALFASCDGSWQVANSSTGSIMESASVTANYYTVTIYIDGSTSFQVKAVSIPEEAELDAYTRYLTSSGYMLTGWYCEETGTLIDSWGATLTEDLTVHAVWALTSANLTTAFANGGYYMLPADLSATSLTVSNDLVLDLNSNTLTASDGVTVNSSGSLTIANGTLVTRLTVESGAKLELANIELSSDASSNSDLITLAGSGSLTISGSTLITEAGGDAIYMSASSGSETIEIDISDTTMYLDPTGGSENYGASTGIRIMGTDTYRISDLTINLEGVDFYDKGDGSKSTMPLDIRYVDQLDVTLSGCDIIIAKNHYMAFKYCGNANSASTINIVDTDITGYSALYIHYDCVNVHVTITGGTITCLNQNSGSGNDVSVVSIQDSKECSITIEGTDITMGRYSADGEATTGLFCHQFNSDPSTSWVSNAGNAFVFKHCDITLVNPRNDSSDSSKILYQYGAIDTYDGDFGATIDIDSYTENSLKNAIGGYTWELTIDTYNWPPLSYYYCLEASSST